MCGGQGGHLTTQHLSSQPHGVTSHCHRSPHWLTSQRLHISAPYCPNHKHLLLSPGVSPIALPDICTGPHSVLAPEAPKKLLWPRCLLPPRILAQATSVITNQQHRPLRPPLRPRQGHQRLTVRAVAVSEVDAPMAVRSLPRRRACKRQTQLVVSNVPPAAVLLWQPLGGNTVAYDGELRWKEVSCAHLQQVFNLTHLHGRVTVLALVVDAAGEHTDGNFISTGQRSITTVSNLMQLKIGF